MAEQIALFASFRNCNTEPVAGLELVPPEAAEPEHILEPDLTEVSSFISDEVPETVSAPTDSQKENDVAMTAVRLGQCQSCFPQWPGSGSGCQPAIPTPPTSQVRFLNAAAVPFPVDVLIDGVVFVRGAVFAAISPYQAVADGFHTVTVRRTNGLRTVLYQNRLPFVGNQWFTLAATDSGSGGLNLARLVDTGCSCQSSRFSCYRVANMSAPGSDFDIRTANGDSVFTDISFGQASSYKQTAAGSYRFFVTSAASIQPIRELPVILQDFCCGSLMTPRPVLAYNAAIAAGKTYTTYLIGNTWSSFPFQALTVEDQ